VEGEQKNGGLLPAVDDRFMMDSKVNTDGEFYFGAAAMTVFYGGFEAPLTNGFGYGLLQAWIRAFKDGYIADITIGVDGDGYHHNAFAYLELASIRIGRPYDSRQLVRMQFNVECICRCKRIHGNGCQKADNKTERVISFHI